jgi:hypothetical protein
MSDSMPETTAVPLYSSATAAAAPTPSPEVAANPEPEATPETTATPTMTLKDAVKNCRKAYNQALAVEKALGVNDYNAKCKAAEAYCATMPLLTSEGNIRAFIACVGYAMLVNIIRRDEGPKLMSIARTALTALPREPRPQGRSKAPNAHQ